MIHFRWSKRFPVSSWLLMTAAMVVTIFIGGCQRTTADENNSQQTAIEKRIYRMLRQDRCINNPKLNFVIFLRKVQGRSLNEVLLKRRDGHGGFDLNTKAEAAEVRVDLKNKVIKIFMHHGFILDEGRSGTGYEDKVFSLPLTSFFMKSQK